ncbi:thioesterase II family protein [Streptomyces sp. NPDC048172]|uniref:thioesterase II family protein n=1 Tax=Streptomyces sp. NPDC048172 TaxID=3365505 RepID=UPI0037165EC0
MGETDSEKWFRVYRRVPEGVRLFCFPHAGGAASYFYPWAGRLPDGIELQVLQYPGRQDRVGEPCVRSVPALADRIHAAIRPRLNRPYAFFGHSMGAVVAFEVACRIAREEGAGPAGPAHLFVSGRRAPSCVRHEELHRAGRSAFVAEMRALGGTDPRVLEDDTILDFVLPTVRADYEAVETYRFGSWEPLPYDVTALAGESDPKAAVEDVRAWSRHTRGTFGLHTYPGGHFYLDDHRSGVLDVVSSALTTAAPGRKPLPHP